MPLDIPAGCEDKPRRGASPTEDKPRRGTSPIEDKPRRGPVPPRTNLAAVPVPPRTNLAVVPKSHRGQTSPRCQCPTEDKPRGGASPTEDKPRRGAKVPPRTNLAVVPVPPAAQRRNLNSPARECRVGVSPSLSPLQRTTLNCKTRTREPRERSTAFTSCCTDNSSFSAETL
jgi:hypothetical protein